MPRPSSTSSESPGVGRKSGYPTNIAELKQQSPFIQSYLSERDHDEGEIHLIGSSLPVPTIVKQSGAASVGVSPIPAREDHFHGTGIVQSGALAYPASAQSIPTTTWTKVTLNSTPFWASNGWTVSNGELVCPETGRFLAIAGVQFDTTAPTANARWDVAIRVNGVNPDPYNQQGEATQATGAMVPQNISCVFSLNAGDKVSLWLYQTVATNKLLLADLTRTFLQVERMGTGAPGAQGPQGETGEKGDPGYYSFGLCVPGVATSIPQTTATPITLGTPTWNTGGWVISGTQATCPQTGKYFVVGQVYTGANVAVNQRAQSLIQVNGANVSPAVHTGITVPASLTVTPVLVAGILNLVAGDKVALCYQHMGSAAAQTTDATWTSLKIEMVGAGPKGNDGATGPVGPQGIQGPQGNPGLDGGSGAVTGSIQMFAGDNAPTGFLLCDGSLKLTTDFPTLFSVIGYKYGGSGVNFAMPNLKGRIPVGLDTAVTMFNTLGKTGGSRNIGVITHVHDVTHVHPIPHAHDHTHYHTVNPPSTSTTSVNAFQGSNMLEIASGNFDLEASGGLNNVAGGGSGPHQHVVDIPQFNSGNPNVLKTDGSDTANSSNNSPTGTDAPVGAVSGTDANVQPYQVVNYIIKT